MKEKKTGFSTKIIILITLLLLVVNVGVGVLLISRSRESMKSLIKERMLGIARTAAATLDGNELDGFTFFDVGGEKQQAIIDKLNLFSDNIDFKYIYVVRKTQDGFIFIVDPDPIDPAVYGQSVLVTPALTSAGNGESAVDDVAVSDQWGTYYSAYCPVMTSDGRIGGIVGVDFDADKYENMVTENTIYILIAGLLSMLIGGTVVFLYAVRLKKDFKRLNEETRSIAEDVSALFDEINSESGYALISSETGSSSDRSSGPDGMKKISGEVKSIKDNLKRYIDYVHTQAYTDSMTGVGSKTAYLELLKAKNEEIKDGTANFSVAVFDVNGLKNVNDEFGHEAGDSLIKGVAKCIRKIFGKQNVFRIGGDEFIAILPEYTEEEMVSSFKKLEEAVSYYNSHMSPDDDLVPVTFSKGHSTFIPVEDKVFRDVFKRADVAMYNDKEDYYRRTGLPRR